MNPLNNVARAYLAGFATALNNAVNDGTALVNSSAGDYTLGDDDALAYAAQAIRNALHRDTVANPTVESTPDDIREALNLNPDLTTTIRIGFLDHHVDTTALHTALTNPASTRPTTGPTTNGQPHDHDPDPYAINLQGPHGTITGADRATPDSLHDLDNRTRAIFKELLYLTLNNLDRQAPTTTGGTR